MTPTKPLPPKASLDFLDRFFERLENATVRLDSSITATTNSSAELPYVFGSLQSAVYTGECIPHPWNNTDRRLSQAMSAYWVNFARTGDPNGKRLPAALQRPGCYSHRSAFHGRSSRGSYGGNQAKKGSSQRSSSEFAAFSRSRSSLAVFHAMPDASSCSRVTIVRGQR